MLADLKDLNLPLEELLILQAKLLLLHDLDSDFLQRLLVDAQLDYAVLTLPKVFSEFIEVEDVRIANGSLYSSHPALFFRLYLSGYKE